MSRKFYIVAMLILVNTMIISQISHAQVHEIYKKLGLPSREPFVLQSPDGKYRIEGIDFIQLGGFTPYSSKVFIEVYDNASNKKISTLKIKEYDTVKQMTFSKNGNYLFFLLIGGATTGEFFMVSFKKLSAGSKRNNARRWSVYPYDEKFTLVDDEDKIIVMFHGIPRRIDDLYKFKNGLSSTVDLTKFKDELYFSVGDASMSIELFTR
jgi:hypothetical protein